LLSGSRTLPSGLRAHTYPRASTLTHAPGLVLWSGKDRVVTSVRRGERGIEASRGGINATSTHRCHADMETAMRPGPGVAILLSLLLARAAGSRADWAYTTWGHDRRRGATGIPGACER